MVESRWFRRAGPAIAAVGSIAFLATTALGAPDRAWQPQTCARPPEVAPGASGAWYRIDPILTAGARAGQRVVMGGAGDGGTRALELESESFATGPFGGVVLVGSDDGARSRLSLVDVEGGCVWPLDAARDVVRTATVAPDRESLFEFRVDRRTRADLGVWRRPIDGSTGPTRILPPIEADARFGRTWSTDFAWSDDARSLAVQSCGELACRFRILDPAAGTVQRVADPGLGDLVGISADRLVARGACGGLPCPLVSVDLVDGSTTVIDPAAGEAVLSRDAEGRPVVVHEVGVTGDVLGMAGLAGQDPRRIVGDPEGRRLLGSPARAASAAEHEPGWIVFAPDGRLPIDGPVPAILRHVSDGRGVPLDEVSR